MDYSPSLDEFLKLADQGNLVPVFCQLLADVETPLSAYRKIKGDGESFLFESVEGGEHLGRYSFVGCNPRSVVRQDGSTVQILENGRVVETFRVERRRHGDNPDQKNPETSPAASGTVHDGLEIVERAMAKYRAVAV